MNGVQTRLKCKPNVKRCKRFVFAAHSPLLHPNTLKTKAIIHFQTDHILTRFVFPPLHRLFLMKRPEGISRQEELFKRFIQLVHKHCTTQREVSFYANKLFITPRYLSTVIQNVTNTTAKSIIDKHVILEIKVLLKSTNLSVQEISNQLCFPDQSFFGRYFKKHTGLSPLQYRNQN